MSPQDWPGCSTFVPVGASGLCEPVLVNNASVAAFIVRQIARNHMRNGEVIRLDGTGRMAPR